VITGSCAVVTPPFGVITSPSAEISGLFAVNFFHSQRFADASMTISSESASAASAYTRSAIISASLFPCDAISGRIPVVHGRFADVTERRDNFFASSP